MAQIHAASFFAPRPWTASEFAALTDVPGIFLCPGNAGFLWGRVILDEAEVLTLAVDPVARRGGEGWRLLDAFVLNAAERGAVRAFLEVAADNAPARALYEKAGFRQTGCRKRYYARADGPAVDALLLHRAIP